MKIGRYHCSETDKKRMYEVKFWKTKIAQSSKFDFTDGDEAAR